VIFGDGEMIEANVKQLLPPKTLTRRLFVSGAAALTGAVASETLLPTPAWAPGVRVDLRAFPDPTNSSNIVNYITSVKDQSGCNSCTAFAVVAMIEGTYNVKYNQSAGDQGLNLSEGQLFFAAGPKDKCSTTHWWPADALAYCAQVGLVREDDGKFVPSTTPLTIATATKLSRPSLKATQTAMKNWISSTGPVVAVMAEYSDFYGFNQGNTPYYPGVAAPTDFWFVGGHVVCIVGYDDNNNYWICKNSWGKTFNPNATYSTPTNPPVQRASPGYVNIAYGGTAPSTAMADCMIDSIDVWGVAFPT